MVTDVVLNDGVAFEVLSCKELLDSVNELFNLHVASLIQVIVVEHVDDRGSCDRHRLALANNVELVNDVLVDSTERLASEELESFNELLRWDELRNVQLCQVHRIRSEEARLCKFLSLRHLEEVLHAASRVHLTIPELHARQHVRVVCVG